MPRVVVSLAGIALVLLLILGQDQRPPAIWDLAHSLLGERAFQLDFKGESAGSLKSRSWLDDQGNIHFHSDFHFALGPDLLQLSSDELIFSHRAPHVLLRAIHQRKFPNRSLNLALQNAPGHYVASIIHPQHEESIDLQFQFNLADYLAMEYWISENHPRLGEEIIVNRLDFDNLGLRPSKLRVARIKPTYVLEDTAPDSALRITLDRDLLPQHMELGGVLQMMPTSQEIKNPSPSSNSYFISHHIPLDRPLPDHQNLHRLRLAVEGADADAFDGPLELMANALAPRSERVNWTNSTLELPLDDPALQALARLAPVSSAYSPGNLHNSAISGHVSEDELRDLVAFVHGSLGYESGLPDRSIADVLQQRSGDCTDYANLFTGLARMRGWPARTVFGLAYTEKPTPGFAFHAWNEVQLAERWQAVDPTWNQIRVDATHIPLAKESALSIRLAEGHADIRFRVLNYQHFEL